MRLPRRALPALVFLAAAAAFLPSLRNGFVDIDDSVNFLQNPFYRGLSWSNLRWMFTTLLGGPYQPLSWLTLGVDHALWGMDPRGYHLTSLLLHAVNAVLLYFLSARLLAAALPGAKPESLRPAAALAALLWGVHPLRVESVAWATERRDVLSGFFYLATLLSYLRAAENGPAARYWRRASWLLYAASLLSKAIGVSLPAVLLVLDAYPLRRRAWAEKLPYAALALAAAGLGVVGQARAGTLHSLDEYGLGARAAIPAFAAAFYVWKTVWPFGLAPLYEAPSRLDPLAARFLAAGAATAGLTAAALALRRRLPAAPAAWACYLLALVPVLGFVPLGKHLAADRYTYLSCLWWSVLAAGLWLPWRERAPLPAGGLAALAALALAALTWRQTSVWRDAESLWTHALRAAPGSSVAHNNLGLELARQGRTEAALAHYRAALALKPDFDLAHNNLGAALVGLGKWSEAEAHYRAAARVNPGYAEAWVNLGFALDRQGRLDSALAAYRTGLGLRPDLAEAGAAFGAALARRERWEEAAAALAGALSRRPDLLAARLNLAYCLTRLGRPAEAARRYREALAQDPGNALARENLARLEAAGAR